FAERLCFLKKSIALHVAFRDDGQAQFTQDLHPIFRVSPFSLLGWLLLDHRSDLVRPSKSIRELSHLNSDDLAERKDELVCCAIVGGVATRKANSACKC